MYDDPATVDRALRAGARGYVLKGRGLDALITAIRQVHRGEVYLSPDLSAHVLPAFLEARVGEVVADPEALLNEVLRAQAAADRRILTGPVGV